MYIYRRKLRRTLRKRAARSCCSRPPRRFIRSTTRTRRRSAFFTLPAESGRPHRAADKQKPESALRTSIGRTLVRADRRRKPPSSRSARGPDRAEPNVRTDVSRADLPRVAFESICDQAAWARIVLILHDWHSAPPQVSRSAYRADGGWHRAERWPASRSDGTRPLI